MIDALHGAVLNLIQANRSVALRQVHEEIASGRAADVGKKFGARSRELLMERAELQAQASEQSSKARLADRLTVSQTALGSMHEAFDTLRVSLLGGSVTKQNAALLSAATTDSLTAALAASFQGGSVFKGGVAIENGGIVAIRKALNDDFLISFGVSKDDPSANKIGGNDLAEWARDFVAKFAAKSDVSSPDATASLNVPEKSILNPLVLSEMVSGLSVGQISEDAFGQFVQVISADLVRAADDLVSKQSEIGYAQTRLAIFKDDSNRRKALAEEALTHLEGADPLQSSSLLSQISAQTEASYRAIARSDQLSLSNFL